MSFGCQTWQAWSIATLTIALCSLASTEAAAQFGGGGPPQDHDTALAFSSDGEILAGGGLDKLRFWDVETGKLLRTVKLPVSWVPAVAFAPRSKTLYAACGDGQIRTCDAETGELKFAINLDADRIYSIAFSPDGTFLACAIEQAMNANAETKVGSVRLWDVGRQILLRPLFTQNELRILGVRYASDGKTLGVAANERLPRYGAVRLWDTKAGTWKPGFAVVNNLVRSLDLSPDGSTLAVGGKDLEGRGIVAVWNVDKGTRIWQWTSLSDSPFQVAFSPDGKSIVGSSAVWQTLANGDRVTVSELSMWDSKTGHVVWSVTGKAGFVDGLAFSPDGKLIASSSSGETKLSDALTGVTRNSLLLSQ